MACRFRKNNQKLSMCDRPCKSFVETGWRDRLLIKWFLLNEARETCSFNRRQEVNE